MQKPFTSQSKLGISYNTKFLLPGELYIAFKPTKIWTILGSCVSVILYSPKDRVSAICHAQLPEQKDGNKRCVDSCPRVCNKTPMEGDFKYVTCSVNFMVNHFLKSGIPTQKLQVGLFGGSNIFRANNEEDIYKIGENNVRVSLKTLEQHGLKPKQCDVGGNNGRILRLDSDTGAISIQIN